MCHAFLFTYPDDLLVAPFKPSQVLRVANFERPKPGTWEWPAVLVLSQQTCDLERAAGRQVSDLERRCATVLKRQHRVDGTLGATHVPRARGGTE